MRLRRWIASAGGKITSEHYSRFVPMFCPSWIARTMEALEPTVEATPVPRHVGCVVVEIVASSQADQFVTSLKVHA